MPTRRLRYDGDESRKAIASVLDWPRPGGAREPEESGEPAGRVS